MGPLLVIAAVVWATTAWNAAPGALGRAQTMLPLPGSGPVGGRKIRDPDSLALSSSLSPLAAAEVGLLNDDRSVAGLPPLIESPALDQIAGERAAQMAAFGGSHYLPGHTTAAAVELLQAEGVNYLWHGENIAWASGLPADQVAAFFNTWWMDSPEHQANLLGAHYRHVGIGAVVSGGWIYIAEEFTD
jgi:uncharacterized protein YkwD